MEVNLKTNVDAIVRAAVSAPRPAVTQDVDQAVSSSFEGAQGLSEALLRTPESRPDLVARAREMVASPNYPPPEMIRNLANLLAANMLTN